MRDHVADESIDLVYLDPPFNSARKLFEESPKQFEIWAVGLVAGVPQPEKAADKGIDSKVYFLAWRRMNLLSATHRSVNPAC